jgi:hypothetical protein
MVANPGDGRVMVLAAQQWAEDIDGCRIAHEERGSRAAAGFDRLKRRVKGSCECGVVTSRHCCKPQLPTLVHLCCLGGLPSAISSLTGNMMPHG